MTILFADFDAVKGLSNPVPRQTSEDGTCDKMEPVLFDLDLPVLDVVLAQDYTFEFEVNGQEFLIDYEGNGIRNLKKATLTTIKNSYHTLMEMK